jgi:alkylhydroperoxidase family enzyme
VWEDVSLHYEETQVVRLLLAIATINVWNRLAVSVHQELPART